VSVGEALAEARHQAGLTVAQVSQRTRIREAIIHDIENDDYSACGGDFYARGHIRGIAKVTGVDPESLIREYDIARQAPQTLTLADIFPDTPTTPVTPGKDARAAPADTGTGPGGPGGIGDGVRVHSVRPAVRFTPCGNRHTAGPGSPGDSPPPKPDLAC